MRRCEIWVARPNPNQGAEVGKLRPMVIAQADPITEAGLGTVIVVPLTTQDRQAPGHCGSRSTAATAFSATPSRWRISPVPWIAPAWGLAPFPPSAETNWQSWSERCWGCWALVSTE